VAVYQKKCAELNSDGVIVCFYILQPVSPLILKSVLPWQSRAM